MKTKIYLTLFLLIAFMYTNATIVTIVDAGFAFSPSTININVGDTINFNISGSHNVVQTTTNGGCTATTGGFTLPFGGGLLLPTTAIGSPGTYFYKCNPHCTAGMTGVINVINGVPAPSLNFSSITSNINEGTATTTISVSITNPNNNPTSVNVVVASGSTATAADYTYTTTTLTFPALSSTAQSVSVAITNDLLDEPNETVLLKLTAPTNGAKITSDSIHVLTIIDNDSIGTGINKIAEIQMQVYPNPVLNKLNIELNESIDHIFITDATGRIVYENKKEIYPSIISIDFSSFANGVYNFVAYKNKNIFNRTIIK